MCASVYNRERERERVPKSVCLVQAPNFKRLKAVFASARLCVPNVYTFNIRGRNNQLKLELHRVDTEKLDDKSHANAEPKASLQELQLKRTIQPN